MVEAAREIGVSTHAPLAGSDKEGEFNAFLTARFQPTLPLRGATFLICCIWVSAQFQPTLPLRGATQFINLAMRKEKFQPTLPLRGATATSC